MASRKVAARSCPEEHLNTSVTSWGMRKSDLGVVRRYRWAPEEGQRGGPLARRRSRGAVGSQAVTTAASIRRELS